MPHQPMQMHVGHPCWSWVCNLSVAFGKSHTNPTGLSKLGCKPCTSRFGKSNHTLAAAALHACSCVMISMCCRLIHKALSLPEGPEAGRCGSLLSGCNSYPHCLPCCPGDANLMVLLSPCCGSFLSGCRSCPPSLCCCPVVLIYHHISQA